MNAAGRADLLDSPEVAASPERGLRSGIHAYAAGPSGVHAIATEQAARLIRSEGETVDTAAEQPLVWIDVAKPGAAEAAFLRDSLGFHPLAVEDCVRGRQRPKLERFPHSLFLVFYAAGVDPGRDRVALSEMHIFFGKRYVVTVHDRRIPQIGEMLARWRAAPAFYRDVGTLAHGLLDSLVDDYFPVLDHFSEQTEQVEGGVFGGGGEDTMQQIFRLRRELVWFRRMVAPQRDVLGTLLRRDLPVIGSELFPYFQDVHDHLIRVTEEIDALRDLLGAALDAHLSVASNQLNQTVRVMTAWTIILMSMALVAGVYGMNFRWMPELEWRWGYAGALGLMLGIGAGLLLFFRRLRWL